ncbi:hypothetical protein [Nocardia cyriacigeorgica]|uniref:hypothetical protein n=1 Tax=Nocardia cyriacigeorgica TaxID=135487 RepID=UPI00245428B4|nr:hypothetical protein [Nocardia cyriacigeorgica]
MRDGLTLPSPRWSGGRKNATLVSGTEVLFLPEDLPTVDAVTVYNGWFPALARPMVVMSAMTAQLSRIAVGRKLIDIASRPMIGPAGGPDAAERASTRSHVVAVATDASGQSSEVHVEGPSAYSLTGELMAWAAQRLASAPVRTAGVVGPVGAFGFETLRDGCADVGLIPVSLTSGYVDADNISR